VDLGDTSRLGDKFSALGAILGTAHARSLVSVNLTAPARPAARYA
jgi:hypothetical protein